MILVMQYYCKYCDYYKIQCSETFPLLKYLQIIFTILVPIVMFIDIMIILIIAIITLMIYYDIKFCYCSSLSFTACLSFYLDNKRCKEVLINCNSLYLLHHENGRMHVNMIINMPAAKIIIKCYMLLPFTDNFVTWTLIVVFKYQLHHQIKNCHQHICITTHNQCSRIKLSILCTYACTYT